jgi:hypothetical protein
VIAALPVFDLISETVLAVGGGNPLWCRSRRRSRSCPR